MRRHWTIQRHHSPLNASCSAVYCNLLAERCTAIYWQNSAVYCNLLTELGGVLQFTGRTVYCNLLTERCTPIYWQNSAVYCNLLTELGGVLQCTGWTHWKRSWGTRVAWYNRVYGRDITLNIQFETSYRSSIVSILRTNVFAYISI